MAIASSCAAASNEEMIGTAKVARAASFSFVRRLQLSLVATPASAGPRIRTGLMRILGEDSPSLLADCCAASESAGR